MTQDTYVMLGFVGFFVLLGVVIWLSNIKLNREIEQMKIQREIDKRESKERIKQHMKDYVQKIIDDDKKTKGFFGPYKSGPKISGIRSSVGLSNGSRTSKIYSGAPGHAIALSGLSNPGLYAGYSSGGSSCSSSSPSSFTDCGGGF